MSALKLISLEDWGFFGEMPRVIAGPCSAESREQLLETAAGLSGIGIKVFRAGLWKPRSRPGSFEGIGTKGLAWLQEVKERFAMKVCTEVASAKHVEECLKNGIDMLWLGARTTANPFLVQEIAEALSGSGIPILVKNPVNPELPLWIGAIERLNREGITKLAAVHRGVSSSEKIPYRNAPQWNMAVELRTRCPNLPVFADPSHIAGDKAYLRELSQRAMDLGFDGLMIESHYKPSCALSDASQQLSPQELKALLESITIRDVFSPDERFCKELEQLRAQLDVIDEDLVADLASRMELSAKIGAMKKAHNVAIIQAGRWEKMLAKISDLAVKYNLDPGFVKEIFCAIHEASVEEQQKS